MPFVEIYTKDGCNNCDTAKRMLNEKNVEYVEYIVGRDISREDVLTRFPTAKTVPIMVVDGKTIKEVDQFQVLLG